MTIPRLVRCLILLAVGAPILIHHTPSRAEEVKLDVPFVATPQAVVDAMLELAHVTKDDYLIDLGSGDGRIPITAARRFGTRGMGVDIDPARVYEANVNAVNARVKDKVEFKKQDLFETDAIVACPSSRYQDLS